MQRIVFTEKSDDFMTTLLTEEMSESKNANDSIHRRREMSLTKIRHKISAVFKNVTPADEYQRKIIDLASISNDSQAIQVYLVPKTLKEALPSYMKKKIDHITKIITNSKKEGESKETKLNLNETYNSTVSSKNQSTLAKDNSNVLMKCNTLLYSENYLERLMQRYKNYLEKNKNINMKLDQQYSDHRKIVTDGKLTADNKMKVDFEGDLAGFKTKYKLRFRSRLGDYHKKKYIKIWEKNNLPPIGLRDNIETVRKIRDEKKKSQK